MTRIDLITQKFIEPLNENTKNLLAPISLMPNDRLHVELDEKGKRFVFTFFAVTSNNEQTKPSWCSRKFIQRIPERKKLVNVLAETWTVAGTDFTAILLNAIWPSEKMTFTKEAKMLYEYLLLRFLKQTDSSRIKAAYRLKGEVPEMPKDFVDHPTFPLMSFQKVALITQIDQEGANEWMEQGTGKTPIIISRICYEAHRLYLKEKRMYRALIVVPKNMRMNWHNKYVDFATRPGKLTVLRGGKLTRVKLMIEAFKFDKDSEYTVMICSYDAVLRSWEALRMIEWDLCVLDEAHMIKSSRTKRWKKIQELRELCKQRAGLTGTPLANTLFDVYTQLEWLGEGLSGFSTYKAFKSYYGRFVRPDGDGQREILRGYQNLPVLQERFSRLCFMITLHEALPELPRQTYDVLEIEMTRFQRDCYTRLQKQLAIEIEAETTKEKNKQLTAGHILTKLLRLSQITAGYLKWDVQIDDDGKVLNPDALYEEIEPNPKVEVIIELLKNKTEKEKTIIWTNWIPVIKMLARRFTKEGIKHVLYYGKTKDDDRQIAQDTYNDDPSVRVFLGNPACGGVGLDLWGYNPKWLNTKKDHGCNTTQMIYYSQNWSMIHRSQSERRATRKFTRVSVQTTDLIVPSTIDEEIAIRVLNKKLTAMELQDVRVVMARILKAVPSVGEDNA